MATNGVNFTYGDGARRESLLDIIVNIDPTEQQLVSGLQQFLVYLLPTREEC